MKILPTQRGGMRNNGHFTRKEYEILSGVLVGQEGTKLFS